MDDNLTPRERFIAAISEAFKHYNDTATDEFGFNMGFDVGDDMIGVEFYDDGGAVIGMVTADLSTITVTEEN